MKGCMVYDSDSPKPSIKINNYVNGFGDINERIISVAVMIIQNK